MLKKASKNLVLLLLCGLVLIAGNGYSLNKMECLRSGKFKISFLKVDDCCKEKSHNTWAISSKCCKITSTFFKTSTLNAHDKTQLIPIISGHNNGFRNNPCEKPIDLNNSFSGFVAYFIPPPPRLLHCLLLI